MALAWYWYAIIGVSIGFVVILWLLLACNLPWNKRKFHCIVREVPAKPEETPEREPTKPITERAKQAVLSEEEILDILLAEEKPRRTKIRSYPEISGEYTNIRNILNFKFESVEDGEKD